MASLYTVRVPFAGYIEVAVEAETESDAMAKAIALDGVQMDIAGDCVDNYEWEAHQHLSRGNFSYVSCNDMHIVSVDPIDAEESQQSQPNTQDGEG